MRIRDYLDQQGIDAPALAERLGVDADVIASRAKRGRHFTKTWAQQLGDESLFQPDKPSRAREDQPPRPHDDSAVRDAPTPPAALPALADTSVAQERIQALYGSVGFALSERTGNPGYAMLTDDQSPAIARAWIKAAEQDNELARRVVALMGSGGAGGELVMAHAVWIMGMAYVSGRSDFDPLGTYGRKYGHFRPRVPVDDGGADWTSAEDAAGDGYPRPDPALG